MSVLFFDDFIRANAANLGANWDADDAARRDWDLDTNTAEAQGSFNNGNLIRTTVGAHAATADVKVTVTQVSASGDGGIMVRITAEQPAQPPNFITGAGYALYISGASPGCNIFRTNPVGTEVQMGSGAAITQVANGVMSFEVSGGAGAVVLKSYYQGVLKETVTDTSGSAITAAGRTGITNWAALANARYKDFKVESLGGGTTYNQSVGGTLSTSGALSKSLSRSLAGAMASAGALLKQGRKFPAGTLATSGALTGVKTALKSLAGTLAPAGSLFKQARKSPGGALASAGALAKNTQRAVAGGLTSAGVVAGAKVALKSLSGSLAPSGALVKQARKSFGGAVASAGSLVRQVNKGCSGALTSAGAIAKTRLVTFAVAGAVAFSGVVAKRTGKATAGSLPASGGVSKRVARSFLGSLASQGSISKLTARVLAGFWSAAGDLVTAVLHGTAEPVAIFTASARDRTFNAATRPAMIAAERSRTFYAQSERD